MRNQTPYLILLYCGRSVRSSHQRCSIKKMFLKISQYPQETPALESLFRKVAGLQACSFMKKRFQHRCSCEYCEIFKTTYFEKNLQKAAFLFFQWFTFWYMDLKVQGLDSMTGSGVMVRVTGLVFCFLSRHLSSWTEYWPAFKNLRQKPLISQLSFSFGLFWLF